MAVLIQVGEIYWNLDIYIKYTDIYTVQISSMNYTNTPVLYNIHILVKRNVL